MKLTTKKVAAGAAGLLLTLGGGRLATGLISQDSKAAAHSGIAEVMNMGQLAPGGSEPGNSTAGVPTTTTPSRAESTAGRSDRVGPGQHEQGKADDEKQTGEEGDERDQADQEGDAHEDPAGQDVEHECPPNCDTANGEKP